MIEKIKELLAKANGMRHTRTLAEKHILYLLADLKTHSWMHGGSVARSYRPKAASTVAVAYRTNSNAIAIGIGVCDAHSPSPGRIWKVLQPWGVGGFETTCKKLEEWSKRPDVAILSDKEVQWWLINHALGGSEGQSNG